jgi:hypothetical protein
MVEAIVMQGFIVAQVWPVLPLICLRKHASGGSGFGSDITERRG